MADYKVFVVDMEGTPYAGSGPDDELADARVSRLSLELNGPGAAEIRLATTDPDAALLVPGREVQIRWDGDIIWWGPIVRVQAGLDETSWQCAGLLWYFERRYLGRADRVNQLVNGDFEDSDTGWSFSGGVTHSIDSSEHIEDPTGHSLKLTGAADGHDTYAYQTWTHPAGSYPGGDWLTCAAFVKVPDADYVGPAYESRGLFLLHWRDGAIINSAGGYSSDLPALIDDDTPKDVWVQPTLETGLPSVIEDDEIEVRLYPPHGVAYWDLVTLTFMESLSFGYPSDPVDASVVLEALVNYAQDRLSFDHGKSDLNIDVDPATVGLNVQRAYQFAEHRNILDAILEYVEMGVCDIDIAITPTTRTFTIYPGQKGNLYGTTLELDVNVAGFSWAFDGEQAASSVVVTGPGDGPDRPEGGATDPAVFGGLTLEVVETAPAEVTIGQLDLRAAEVLAGVSNPQILTVTTLPGAGVIGDLQVGDTVPVLISRGVVDVDDIYRVFKIDADLVADQATIILNPV